LLRKLGGSKPPSEEEAAHRALCLGIVVLRGRAELDLREAAGNEAAAEVQALNAWVAAEKVVRHFSNGEMTLLEKPAGTWSEQEIVNASWRAESLGVILWALSVVERVPLYDMQFDPERLIGLIAFSDGSEAFIRRVKLRPAEEVASARDLAELWHWRSRTAQIQDDPSIELPEGMSFPMIIETAANAAYETRDIPPPIDGDFPVFGKAYAAVEDEEYSVATSIAMERHFAFNWLCGYSRDWDETPTDT
jgi:hypothetical protein